MWHHFGVLFFMLCWMIAPLAIFGYAPRKHRDPFLWVFAATLLGPLVALVFFALPAKPQAA